jgi:hypothetical protein
MERCEDSGLININLEHEYIRRQEHSSKGTQPKYYKDNIWYKQNFTGYESKAERLCSLLLSFSNIEDYVSYEECIINKRNGCYSPNFLQLEEECVTLQRLYEYYQGGNLSDAILINKDIEARITFVLDFVKEAIYLDLRDYLAKLLTFDMLTLNIDRHFHNICVIRKKDGSYRQAPVFDNGAALLSNYGIFPMDVSLEENIEHAIAAPFSGSFELQAQVLGMPLRINSEIKKRLDSFPATRAKQVLEWQMAKYKFLFYHY